ncbi:hypothetical protein K439DRAFT_1613626 [Ramaria rubella]|nr:hypothetical protein K439DRAFT_1613626 [Ramaria rubella]
MIIRVAALLHAVAATMASSIGQVVMTPNNINDYVRPEGNLPTLADLLTVEGRASIFYSYARETDMSARFVEQGEGTTVFVPTNKAVQALARKPHEDPEEDTVDVSDAEHEAISKSNVQRWVGAHLIPSPNVDFTSTVPYDTLTAGATISFQAIGSEHRPTYDPVIDADAAHFASIKGRGSQADADSAHRTAVKGCPYAKSSRGRAVHKASHPNVDTDAAHFASIKGPATPDHAPQVDTDAAHLSSVKESQATPHTPIWKQYEVNDGVRVIARKQASNGVLYLIDGTVLV